MKEIKTYLRPQLVDQLVHALEQAGAKDLIVIRMEAFGPVADTATDEHHLFRKYAEKYSAVVKLELVCCDEDAARFAGAIQENAHAGGHGDGRILIANVDEAINIRTGECGNGALSGLRSQVSRRYSSVHRSYSVGCTWKRQKQNGRPI